MNVLIRRITADKIIRLAMLITIGLLLLQFIYIVLNFNHIPPVIPLFNQLPWGEQRLGDKLYIFLPLLLVLGLCITNIILSSVFYERMPLISRILGVTNMLLSLLSIIFIVRTVQLIV